MRVACRKITGSVWCCCVVTTCPEKLLPLLRIHNSALDDAELQGWRTTCPHMSPQKLRAMHASDVKPIANARLLLCFAPARVEVKHYDYDPIGA